MNDNNNANRSELTVKSYKIESNRDNDGTYSVEIETSAHTIVYPKAIVTFGANQAICFPVGFRIVDDKSNVLFNYSLDLRPEDSEEVAKEK